MFQIETVIFSFILKNEIKIIHLLAVLMFICGFIVYVILLYQPATYGRYSSTGKFYSIAVPARSSRRTSFFSVNILCDTFIIWICRC